MKLAGLVATSAAVAETRSRNAKRDAVAACLLALDPSEVVAGVHYLSGSLAARPRGHWAGLLRRCATVPAAAAPTLEIAGVDSASCQASRRQGQGRRNGSARASTHAVRQRYGGPSSAF